MSSINQDRHGGGIGFEPDPSTTTDFLSNLGRARHLDFLLPLFLTSDTRLVLLNPSVTETCSSTLGVYRSTHSHLKAL